MKNLLFIFFSFFAVLGRSQDVAVLFKQANNLEIQFRETEALEKYKQILLAEPNNIKALVKATELNCSTGERLINKTDQRLAFESAMAFAERAQKEDPSNANGYYALALAFTKLAETEKENRKITDYLKAAIDDANRAIALQPDHAMAHFVAGKWFYDLTTMNWIKRLSLKTLYGGLPETVMDSAIYHLEKCRGLEPYFMEGYLYLAKAYQQNNRPALEIGVLQKLVKLPLRTPDDAGYKAEGQKMLDEVQ